MVNSATLTYTGVPYDFAIAGLPFNSAASKETPIRRETSPLQKDQQDNSVEPGESSLGFWWLRSQSSFHGGAGQKFLDGQNQDDSRHIRFSDSYGVDVWTQGQVTMLDGVGSTNVVNNWDIDPISYGGTSVIYVRRSGTTRFIETATFPTGAGSLTPTTFTEFSSAAATFTSLCTDGVQFYYTQVSGGVSTIQRGTIGTAVHTAAYNNPSPGIVYWVKNRLIFTHSTTGAIYELNPQAAAAALPTPLYTPASTYTSFSSFVEAPTGIYCIERNQASNTSYVDFIGLSTASGTPTLAPPVQVLALPDNEQVQGLCFYLGFLGICTSRGFRVAKAASDGTLTVGPLLFDGYAYSATGHDRFMYVYVDSRTGTVQPAGIVRVDLSEQLPSVESPYSDSLRFAYANDLVMSAKPVFLSDGRMVGMTGSGSSRTLSVSYLKSNGGALITSKIRYATTEYKLFRQLSISGSGSSVAGSVTAKLQDPSGTLSSVICTLTYPTSNYQVTGSSTLTPCEYVRVRLDFNNPNWASGDDLSIVSYQLRALPAPSGTRQRIIQLPLKCFDRELANGQRVFSEGTAYTRLVALEALESAGDVVTLQQIGADAEDSWSASVVIESVQFAQTSEPKDREGFGGIITLTVRTVT